MRKHTLSVLAAAAVGLYGQYGISGGSTAQGSRLCATSGAASPYTWTGCYIGGKRRRGIYPRRGGFQCLDQSVRQVLAFTGGGQIGCDYQFAWRLGDRLPQYV